MHWCLKCGWADVIPCLMHARAPPCVGSLISFDHTEIYFRVELTQSFLIKVLAFLLFYVIVCVLLFNQTTLIALKVTLIAFLSGLSAKIFFFDQRRLNLLLFGTYSIFLDDHYRESEVLWWLLNDGSPLFHVRFYEIRYLLPIFFFLINVHPGIVVGILQVVLFSFLEEPLLWLWAGQLLSIYVQVICLVVGHWKVFIEQDQEPHSIMFAAVHEGQVFGGQAIVVLDIDLLAGDQLSQRLQELQVVVDHPKVERSVAPHQSLFMDIQHFILEERVKLVQGSYAPWWDSYLKQVGKNLLKLLFFVYLLRLLIARILFVLQDTAFSIWQQQSSDKFFLHVDDSIVKGVVEEVARDIRVGSFPQEHHCLLLVPILGRNQQRSHVRSIGELEDLFQRLEALHLLLLALGELVLEDW